MKILKILSVVIGAAGLSACSVFTPSTDSSRYYVLNFQSPGAQQAFAGKAVKLVLRKIEVPTYLKGRSMIVRHGDNEIQYIDSARWAEPVDLAFGRILKEGLGALNQISQVIAPPYSVDAVRDYDVVVHVLNCEGYVSGKSETGVLFRATVEVYKPGINGDRVSQFDFVATGYNWNGRDYSALSNGISDAVSQLCAKIAAEVTRPGS